MDLWQVGGGDAELLAREGADHVADVVQRCPRIADDTAEAQTIDHGTDAFGNDMGISDGPECARGCAIVNQTHHFFPILSSQLLAQRLQRGVMCDDCPEFEPEDILVEEHSRVRQADFQERGQHTQMVTISTQFGEALGRFADGPTQRMHEHLFFAAEVVVHDARRDACFHRDVAHAHPGGAVAHKHPGSCRHELLSPVEGIFGHEIPRNRH